MRRMYLKNGEHSSELASDEVLKYNDKVFRDCIRGTGECAIRVSSQPRICVNHYGQDERLQKGTWALVEGKPCS